MRGDIVVNGKKMTATELVELYLETRNDLDTAHKCLEARKEEFDSLNMRCIPSAAIDFQNHLFGNLVIIPNSKYEEMRKQIKELESELRVKEELFKIKSGLKSEELPDSITIDGYKCQIIQTEQGLYISRDDIYRIIEDEKQELRDRIEKQEQRYQSDFITINQLHTTIDVLTDKLARLREVKGL